MWDSPHNDDEVPTPPTRDAARPEVVPPALQKTEVIDVPSFTRATSTPPPPPVTAPTPTPATAPSSPTPFSSIGAVPVVNPAVVPPAPAPVASNATSVPASLVPAAGATTVASPSVAPPSVAVPASSPRRRRWPLFLLALLTVLGSGLVSWVVANSVNDNDNDTVASAEVASDSAIDGRDETDSAASAQPAIQGEASPTPSITNQSTSAASLSDEPFAVAAEIIRPSVVQLNLGQGLGTGVIIDEDGTILTAAHVVGNSTEVGVTFFDGSSVQGEVVGTHAPTDVAVVKVDPAGRTLVPAAIAEGDDVRVGQLAVAVGSPFGFDQTVTAGIISAVDRLVPGSDASFVQTDAPINPGNSGGPLINLSGEVVGINDLIFTESGSSAGVGFAISVDLAVIIAEQLIDGVEPQFARLGVSTSTPANGDRGAQVQEVVAGSAADDAGLEVGDIVLALNGTNTRGTAELRAQILDQVPGSDINITILRDGQEQTVTATLGRSS